jgi:hypothetical protein
MNAPSAADPNPHMLPSQSSNVTPTNSNVQPVRVPEDPDASELLRIQEERDDIQLKPRPIQARHYTTLQDHADDLHNTVPTEGRGSLRSRQSARRDGFV